MRKFSFFIVVIFLFSGCSLKYEESVSAEESNPEFVFYNTQLIRYEHDKPTVFVNAENIEQYKGSDSSYVKNVKFKTFNSKNEIDTEGSCGLLYTDTNKEIYELYDGIKLFSKANETNFYADILRWNAKTEQLTSGRTDTVRLEKDGTVIIGSGFSASGISGKFNFTGSVSGDIETKSKEENKPESEK